MSKKILAVFFLPVLLMAAPIGNTAAPEILQRGFFIPSKCDTSVRLAYEGDFVTDARMDQFDQGSGRVDNYHQYAGSGLITWNFVDRLDVYSVLGMSKVHADWRFSLGEEWIRITMKSEGAFVWGLGSRAILYEWGPVFLGCGGRYSSADYELRRFSSDGSGYPVEGAAIEWRQWQVNLDICYKITILTPYVGAKYSHERAYLSGFSTAIASDGEGVNSFENRSPVGVYLGCALSNGKYFSLNIEGRLLDEEAVTVTADFRF
jgi:hypothetical protein